MNAATLRSPLLFPRRGLVPFVALLSVLSIPGAGESSAQEVAFTKDVAPIFVTHCTNCHIRGRKGGFQMQSFDQLISSGQVTAGKPDESELIRLVSSGEMPPKSELPEAEVDTLRRWVEAGATFDGSDSEAMLTSIAKPSGASRQGPVNRGDAEGYANQSSAGSSAAGGGYSGAEAEAYGGEGEMMEEEMGYGGADYDGAGGTGYGAGTGYGRRSQGGSFLALLKERFSPVEPNTLLSLSQSGDVPTGPALGREAELAFAAGNLPAAVQLYLGHIVAEFDQASEAVDSVRYSAALRRPVWHTRWGVSLMVRGDTSIEDFAPIEVGFADGNNRMASRGRQGGYGGGAATPGGTGEEMGYGEGYGDTEMEEQMTEDLGYGNSLGEQTESAGRQPAEPEVPEVEIQMLDESVRTRFEKVLGLVATKTEAAFGSRYRDGQFGNALTGVAEVEMPTPESTTPNRRRDGNPAGRRGAAQTGASSGMSTPGNGMADARRAAGTPEAEEPSFSQRQYAEMAPYASPELPMWTPGFLFLGEGASKEMVKTAEEHGIELLLHFDVAVKTGRDGTVQNVSRCRVVHVASGKTVGVSKSLDSEEAMRLVEFERSTEEKYVEEQLQNLLDIVDDKLALAPMPELTPEVAKRRVASLIGNPGTPPLRTLAEIRLYQAQGLLSDSEVEAAFEIAAGDDGLLLLHGPTDEKQSVVRNMATTP